MTTKFHVPIDNKDEVKCTSTGSGLISKITWNPSKGQKEQEDLARARQIAFEEMMEAERKANEPNEQRFCLLENRLEAVEKKMEELLRLYGQK